MDTRKIIQNVIEYIDENIKSEISNYDLKSRQALPDGVFGHFNARKSYPFILF